MSMYLRVHGCNWGGFTSGGFQMSQLSVRANDLRATKAKASMVLADVVQASDWGANMLLLAQRTNSMGPLLGVASMQISSGTTVMSFNSLPIQMALYIMNVDPE
jgi:Fe-S cluster assembly scaffold protein SufB